MLPFGIGFSEVLLILVVLLLVVGPNKLPELAKTVGKGMRSVRRAGRDLRDAIDTEELRREVYRPIREWEQQPPVEDAVAEPFVPTLPAGVIPPAAPLAGEAPGGEAPGGEALRDPDEEAQAEGAEDAPPAIVPRGSLAAAEPPAEPGEDDGRPSS